MEDKKNENRGPRKTTKITFAIVHKIKAFKQKQISAETAAEEAGMPISTFYRYSKMDIQELYAMARETQYEAMTPEQRQSYDAQMERQRKFASIVASVNERRKLEQERFEQKKKSCSYGICQRQS